MRMVGRCKECREPVTARVEELVEGGEELTLITRFVVEGRCEHVREGSATVEPSVTDDVERCPEP